MGNKVFHHYDVAYKMLGMDKFEIVTPPKYGWIADPFLVEWQGEMYLFAEIFLYLSERNGVIGYCKYDMENEAWTEWTVSMDKHWHLSYPNVWVENGKLFMCPESYQLEEVAVYELVELPNKWKKVNTVIENVEYCDSTFLEYENKKYMFTFERHIPSPNGIGLIFDIDSNYKAINKRFLTDSLRGARCGGKFIHENNMIYRVAQNCEKEYGGGLLFFQVDQIEPEYKEHEVKSIEVSDLRPEWQEKYTGIHTYNRCNCFEVIDLRWPSSTKEENEASDRVHKVFVEKYN